mgnify:CR=1 FL=1
MAKGIPSWVLQPKPEEPSALDTVGDWLGVGVNAITPYTAAATAGGTVGSVIPGVGTGLGAAGGVTALGLGDLATGGYNLVAPVFGGERVPLPSETIQNALTSVGVGRKPTTPGQQVFSDTLQATTGAGAQALSARELSRFLASPRAQNWMKFLSENPKAQSVAAAGGAAAPSVAANYMGVTNPYALTALSLAGGMAAGKATIPKVTVPKITQVQADARAAYEAAEAAGVRVSQPALAQLGIDVRQRLAGVQYDPGTQPQARKWLNILDKNFSGPISFQKLDALHADIMAEARTITNSRQRLMLEKIGNALDDFIAGIDNTKIVAGNPAAATAALEKARGLWRAKSQMQTLDNAATVALDRSQQSGKSFSDSLQVEYRKILNNKKVFSRLSPELQAAVRDVANGTRSSRAAAIIAKLSPTNRDALWAEIMAGGAGYAATQHPAAALLAAGTAVAGATAKGVSNRMIKSQAAKANALAAAPAMPTPGGPAWYLMSPTAQQAILAKQKGEAATQRRDRVSPPSWVIPAK